MKVHIQTSSHHKGFTLVELLVVIAIIAVLATMAVAGANMAKNAANNAKARAAIQEVARAIDAYSDAEDQLPLSEGQDQDTEIRTDRELMNVLVGIDRDANPTGVAHFNYKKAKGANNNYYDGLYRTETTAEFYGPWKNRNDNDRYYFVILNYDYDDYIREPSTLGNEQVFGVKYLIYHRGKDGEIGQEQNIDNIYSWKGN